MTYTLFAKPLLLLCLCYLPLVLCNDSSETNKDWFTIEGKVQAPDHWARTYGDWKINTLVLVDGGEYRGYLKYSLYFYKSTLC